MLQMMICKIVNHVIIIFYSSIIDINKLSGLELEDKSKPSTEVGVIRCKLPS